MATCDVCGRVENMPYRCHHCGGTHCGEHRLPENHDCPGLEDWGDPGGVFDSGFDASVRSGDGSASRRVADRIGLTSVTGYFKGNVAYLMLALMWVTFVVQQLAFVVGGVDLYQFLFVLRPQNPEFVWTWVTSIFAHGGLYHIVGNSIVIFFFGPLLERYIGSRKFVVLFIVSGILAGLGQIAIPIIRGTVTFQTPGVLGASGAALAILGVLTVLNPGLRVYLYFILPIPLWAITLGYAGISLFFLGPGAGAGGNIAHAAHLVGLLIGLGYGLYFKRTRNVQAPRRLDFGGGGPGGPGGPGGGRRRGPF
ncbi:MAG: rhomboid family intramembrane serine protease [Natrialbaceae archaeon]|nr:rhomboid family intramembrane serine protease [Natrialbaceae archaeon]